MDVSDVENFFTHIEKSTYQSIAPVWNFLLSSLELEYLKGFGCSVCWETVSSDDDLIIICDVCQLRTHQSCYGVPLIPSGGWVCDSCSHLLSNCGPKERECMLCPKEASWGPLKKISNASWAHCLCCRALQAEIKVNNDEFFADIITDSIDDRRWKLLCIFCRKRQGAPVQCSQKGCYSSFHAYCAFEHCCGLSKENWTFQCDTHKTAGSSHRSTTSRRNHQNIHFLSRLPVSLTEADTSASQIFDVGHDLMILWTRYRVVKKIKEQAFRTLAPSALSEDPRVLSKKRDWVSQARAASATLELVEKIERSRHIILTSYFQFLDIVLKFEKRSYIEFCRIIL